MSCGGRIYKGDTIVVSIPFDVEDYTDLVVSYFTVGDVKIIRSGSELEVEDGYITCTFIGHDLDLLPDGVLRYTINYAVDNTDYVESSNTMLFLKTPASYSAMTETEVFQSGYTQGYQGGYDAGYDAGYDDGQQECPDCDCESAVTAAYSSGITAGAAQQKSRLGSATFTANTTYNNSSDGWSSVTVNVPKSVSLGSLSAEPLPSELVNGNWSRTFNSAATPLVDGWGSVNIDMSEIIDYGRADQKSKLGATAFTQNNTYTTTGNGWSSVTINVPTGDCSTAIANAYQSGLTGGAAEQKSKLGRLDINKSGYFTTTGDGWSAVSVNVPQETKMPMIEGMVSASTSITSLDIIDITHTTDVDGSYGYLAIFVDGDVVGTGTDAVIPQGEHLVGIASMTEENVCISPNFQSGYWEYVYAKLA